MSDPVEIPVAAPDFNPPGLDEALDKINGPEEPTPEAPAAPEEVKPEAPKPDAGDDEKIAWLKGLDEQTLKDYREGKAIPKHRFDEVLQRMKIYESFGTPEELIAKLKATATPPAKADEPLSDEDKAFQAYVLKAFPEMKDMPQTFQEMKQFMQEFKKSREESQSREAESRNTLIKSAETRIKALCEAHGLPVDDENMRLHIGNITDILHSEKNKELADRFYNQRDVEVTKPVFDDYYKRFFSGFQRKAKSEILKDKDNLAKLPRAPVKGGAAPLEPGVKKPKSFDEAGDAGWEAMQAANATP